MLLIGGGGREHALAWKLRQSPLLSALFIAPGNAGTALEGENVALDIADHAAVVSWAREQSIDFAVIGPDARVVAGLGDDLRAAGIACFAPSRAAAQVEGSKTFTKTLCDEMGIPTARWRRFEAEAPALAYLTAHGAPLVVKADGLAAGKGVTVAGTLAEAEAAVRACFAGAFGEAGAAVVIEELLEGEEASLFALSDGETVVPFGGAQDHKRAFDGDRGPNTGGMGAYSPAPVLDAATTERALREIIEPAIRGLRARGTPFRGVLFAGLMLTAEGPKLIEFNARFGDPETQVLLPRLRSDLLPLLHAAATGSLRGMEPEWLDETALTVVLATRGYPGPYARGSEIGGLAKAAATGALLFHAGTRHEGPRLLADGGRVLAVTALGRTVAEAQARAYAAVDKINWPAGYHRRDIGWRALDRAKAGD